MLRAAALTDTIILLNPRGEEPVGEGPYGDPVFDPDAGTEARAFVTPLDATEDEINREVRLNRYTVLVETEAPVDGLSQVEWKGKTYDVLGEPKVYSGHLGMTHHLELEIRSVEG